MASRVLNVILNGPSALLEACLLVFSVIFVPWRSSFEPIKSLLNGSTDEKDDLTSSWRDRKLAELTFVGLTVSMGFYFCPCSVIL